MAENPNSIVNLSRANVLAVDESHFGLNLMHQIMLGFGVRHYYEAHSLSEATDLLQSMPIDLVLLDCEIGGGDGYDLTRWLRRSGLEHNAYTPVIMTVGHTKASKIKKARDCGANFTIARPFSPATLLDRIIWVAHDGRSYLECEDYVGPDRRIREGDPPGGTERRARGFLSAAPPAPAKMDGEAIA